MSPEPERFSLATWLGFIGLLIWTVGVGWALAVWSAVSMGLVPTIGTVLLVVSLMTDGFTDAFFFSGRPLGLLLSAGTVGWWTTLANGAAIALSIIILKAFPTLARSSVLTSLGALAFVAGAALVIRGQRKRWQRWDVSRAFRRARQPKPVESAATTSWQQVDIILLTVSEVKHLPDALWISGKGYALFDGGKGGFMWRSATPPQIEITIRSSDPHRLTCERLLAQGIPAGKGLSLSGAGSFRSPLLALDSVTLCALVDPS